MTDRKLFLIRHAPPVVDLATPATGWPLEPNAADTMADVIVRLQAVDEPEIWTSPERKTRETAAILCNALSTPPARALDDLCEHKRDGVERPQSREEFHAVQRRFFAEPDTLVFGHETANQALSRFRRGVTQVLAESRRTPIVSTHGTVISLLVAEQTGIDVFDFWSGLKMPDLVTLEATSSLLDAG